MCASGVARGDGEHTSPAAEGISSARFLRASKTSGWSRGGVTRDRHGRGTVEAATTSEGRISP
eukprot:scaffold132166_cov60-Phaeocystis_antarctica.AAC.2